MLAQKNHLGASWAVLGALGRLLGGPGDVLGAYRKNDEKKKGAKMKIDAKSGAQVGVIRRSGDERGSILGPPNN